MRSSVMKSIRTECEQFCRVRKCPEYLNRLIDLAKRDYVATPKNKRHLWNFRKMKV